MFVITSCVKDPWTQTGQLREIREYNAIVWIQEELLAAIFFYFCTSQSCKLNETKKEKGIIVWIALVVRVGNKLWTIFRWNLIL